MFLFRNWFDVNNIKYLWYLQLKCKICLILLGNHFGIVTNAEMNGESCIFLLCFRFLLWALQKIWMRIVFVNFIVCVVVVCMCGIVEGRPISQLSLEK